MPDRAKRPVKKMAPNFNWAIGARLKSQSLLLALYKLGGDDPHKTFRTDERRSVFALFIGAAFSLWRAAFLADTEGNRRSKSLQDAPQLLDKLLTDNAVSFTQDRNARHWMIGYYLNNALYRLLKVSQTVSNAKAGDTLRELEKTIAATRAVDAWNVLSDILAEMVKAFPIAHKRGRRRRPIPNRTSK